MAFEALSQHAQKATCARLNEYEIELRVLNLGDRLNGIFFLQTFREAGVSILCIKISVTLLPLPIRSSKAGHSRRDCSKPFGLLRSRPFQFSAHPFRSSSQRKHPITDLKKKKENWSKKKNSGERKGALSMIDWIKKQDTPTVEEASKKDEKGELFFRGHVH
ncbi:hypothetical protein AVEN_188386-1 [Araneus ventricosus]|uniref:Uncharacterized protein n=1 Tax=Araneus ventricosus TaxID=182803 RepID=A0A4Y2ECL7_ARAVE|nr:hypothetical protein AVEN_188386-1 [Araneus ventricosus]